MAEATAVVDREIPTPTTKRRILTAQHYCNIIATLSLPHIGDNF